jgi:hypothetical protein
MHLEFYRIDGGPRIHAEPLHEVDFDRARLTAHWEGFRAGRFPDYDPGRDCGRIAPVFANPGGGSPRAVGFDVEIPTAEGAVHRVRFGAGHFRERARHAARELVRLGRVADGTRLHFALAACPAGAGASAPAGLLFTLERATTAIAVRPGTRPASGPDQAWDAPEPDDFPVLIHRAVIADALAEAAGDPEHEAGGFLLGHLRRDDATRRPYLEITGLVPAQATEATAASLTFTPESWAHVRRLIDLRGAGEILVGWMHSHPFRFCTECPVPAPAECIAKVLFFSRDDEFVMETAFPQPFMVGLVAAVEPRLEAALGHPPVRLFGWDRGVIRARGFHVVGAGSDPS